jgi:hypothetical protein
VQIDLGPKRAPAAPAVPPAGAAKPVYNLNPFEQGARRDLGAPLEAPKAREPGEPPPAGRAGEGRA